MLNTTLGEQAFFTHPGVMSDPGEYGAESVRRREICSLNCHRDGPMRSTDIGHLDFIISRREAG